MTKINVNKDTCIGCGTCVAIASNTFDMNSENKAEVKKVDGDDKETIKTAAESCPVNAISIEEDK